jgi:hypothetical protein
VSHPINRGSLALAVALLAAPTTLVAQQTLHVPAQFTTIQAALDAAQSGDTVLVADGTYRGAGNRDLSFSGKDLVVKSVNGPEVTIINAEGTTSEPYRGFVFENGETRAATLEGFTITGGATLAGAVADQFNGGAVIIRSSSPTLRNMHFVGNSSGCWGGAVYSGDTGIDSGEASPLIENCLFANNSTDDDGGGFFTWGFQSQPVQPTVIRNSVFVDNSAAVTGGAITDFGGSNLLLENVTVVGNAALFGSGLNVGDVTIRNSIIWGNGGDDLQLWATSDVTYSNVQGGTLGVGNVDVDPGFGPDGWHLSKASPLVNAGGPVSSQGQKDIDGQPRVLDGRPDMGADEFSYGGARVTGVSKK